MQTKGQNAIEFLTTYSFAFLIIALVLAILLLFAALPKGVFPVQCSFYGGFSCSDASYFALSSGSQMVLLGTFAQAGIVNITGFSVSLGNQQSTSGFCTPNVIYQGQQVYCVANFSSPATLGDIYSGSFTISANYCPNTVSNIRNSTNCIGSNAFKFGGNIRVEGSQYTQADLPPISYLYCVGGSGGSRNTQYAALSQTGISALSISSYFYPIKLSNAGCVIYDNYIYCIGSGTSPNNQAYYAQLTYKGTGKWTATNSYPTSFSNAGCTVNGGYVYCFGGSTNSVYYAPLASWGVGNWLLSSNGYPLTGAFSGACTDYHGYIYCVGSNTAPSNQAYYAKIGANGIGTWTMTTNTPIAFSGAGCSEYNGFIYCVGSSTGSENQVYYAPVSSTGIGNWIATTPYPIAFSNDGCDIYNGYIYCIGGATAPYTQVYYAPILNPGIGQWTATTNAVTNMQNTYCSINGDSGGYLSGGGSATN